MWLITQLEKNNNILLTTMRGMILNGHLAYEMTSKQITNSYVEIVQNSILR